MASINYRDPEKRDYEQDEANASGSAANVNAAYSQQQGNTANTITGNNAYDASHRGSYYHPEDIGTNINSFVGSGIRGAAGASAALYGQKVATDSNLSQYANSPTYQAGLAMGGSGYQYDDPYGFMSGVTELNGKIGDALGGYAGSSYADYLKSPEYGDLADRYRQAGQLAMEDTLGTASQMSGGLDSSYATAAAQQAYNGYMSNLQQAAQQAYQTQLSNQQAQLSALQGERGDLANLYASDWTRGYTADRDTQDDAYKWYFGLEDLAASRLASDRNQSNTETSLEQNQQSLNEQSRQNQWERDYQDRAYQDSRDDTAQSSTLDRANVLESINMQRLRLGQQPLTWADVVRKYGIN